MTAYHLRSTNWLLNVRPGEAEKSRNLVWPWPQRTRTIVLAQQTRCWISATSALHLLVMWKVYLLCNTHSVPLLFAFRVLLHSVPVARVCFASNGDALTLPFLPNAFGNLLFCRPKAHFLVLIWKCAVVLQGTNGFWVTFLNMRVSRYAIDIWPESVIIQRARLAGFTQDPASLKWCWALSRVAINTINTYLKQANCGSCKP